MKYWGCWKGWAEASCRCVYVCACKHCLTVEAVNVVSAPPNQNKPLTPPVYSSNQKSGLQYTFHWKYTIVSLVFPPAPPSLSLLLFVLTHTPAELSQIQSHLYSHSFNHFFSLHLRFPMQISSSHLSAYSPSLSALFLSLCFPVGPQSSSVCVCLVSQRAELQYRQFSTVERAHQTCAPLSLRADNMGPSYLLGASEPPLLPLNELQRGSQIDRNTERAALFDWRSCQGEPKVLSQACAAFHKAALLSWLGLNGTVMTKTSPPRPWPPRTHTCIQPPYCPRQGRVISKGFRDLNVEAS